jgi:hypothetical protein
VLLLTACGDGVSFDPFWSLGSGGDTWESRFADLPAPDWDTRATVT